MDLSVYSISIGKHPEVVNKDKSATGIGYTPISRSCVSAQLNAFFATSLTKYISLTLYFLLGLIKLDESFLSLFQSKYQVALFAPVDLLINETSTSNPQESPFKYEEEKSARGTGYITIDFVSESAHPL